MKLITELSEEVSFLYEAREDGNKDLYLEGRFIVGDMKNKNGRTYPMDVLRPEVDRYVTEMVNTGRALGECGHPSGPTVNLERVSHRITKLKEHRGGYEGKALITKTPMGNIVKGLLESGAKIGVSTRGMGSLKENNGAMEVQKDFKLATIDCVSDPSGPNCFVNGIMEGVEYFYDDIRGTWKEEKVHELKETVHKLSKAEIEEQALQLMEDYFSIFINKK